MSAHGTKWPIVPDPLAVVCKKHGVHDGLQLSRVRVNTETKFDSRASGTGIRLLDLRRELAN
jgi:hypothetical protein